MSLSDALIHELKMEADGTKRCLTILPESEFGWKPHERSMPLGMLASHIADIPQWGIVTLEQDSFDMDVENYKPWVASSSAELMAKFEECQAAFTVALKKATDEQLMTTWKMSVNGEPKIEAPRIGVLRGMIFNHLYHHRGQLTVYMRKLGILVPAIYGPSADEEG